MIRLPYRSNVDQNGICMVLLLLLIVFHIMVSLNVPEVSGLGCIHQICEDNDLNEIRPCPDEDGQCGDYEGVREGKQKLKAVDVECEKDKVVYAPFSGVMEYWRPYGGQNGKECADKGLRIEGHGQWQGYVVEIAFVEPDDYGGEVEQGDRIGVKIDTTCLPDKTESFTPHLRISLSKSGKLIDPKYHLTECMCTGQICESNKHNALLGKPFQSTSEFNGVKGWEIDCRDTKDMDLGDNTVNPDAELRAPRIMSPIDAEFIGRIRLHQREGQYKSCENDGIVLRGTNKWNGFTARIYNVKFSNPPGLGRMSIRQGQDIGVRLDCPDKGINSVMMELRRNGKLINATDMILANNCRLPPPN